MSEYKMKQYELQSYFKSVCNSFYIAYDQVRRLEKELYRLDSAEEESGKKHELVAIIDFWSNKMWNSIDTIKEVLSEAENNSIIVTTKEEVYALMAFYTDNSAEGYPVINREEQYEKLLPAGEKMYEDFLKAYDWDVYAGAKGTDYGKLAMEEVHYKYF